MLRLSWIPLALTVVLSAAPPAYASSKTHGKVVAGWVEKITLLPWNVMVKAKLDTGALTSSVHARDVERFTREDEKWVRFKLAIDPVAGEPATVTVERPLVRRVAIKGAEKEPDSRLVVELSICMNGRRHEVDFSLADRSMLIYPVLLGRRFLEEVALVDAAETFLTKATCDLPPTPQAPAK